MLQTPESDLTNARCVGSGMREDLTTDLCRCDSDVLLRHSRRHLPKDDSAAANPHDRGQDAIVDRDDHRALDAYTTPQVEGFATPTMGHGFESANGQQPWLGNEGAFQHGHLNGMSPLNAFAVDPSLMNPPTNDSSVYQTSPSMDPTSDGGVPFAYGFNSETFWHAQPYYQANQLDNVEANGRSAENHVLENENVYSSHSRHPSLSDANVRSSWENIDPELMSGWNGEDESGQAPLNGDPQRSTETYSHWSVNK
ncbi:hypothetical protein PV08_04608 [Exophiala spinifera]|uniref:Uncharacterized protein n=1 Tax=Exophiala spinifera TaxID=91928 RepID=A0A0D2C149_9EURO|nr:uncharacterized protein PV08_04608 [Exophiala spinifera]KIW17414.1 hypothetical protein PV08_04608 [Exophiala spinifera]